LPVMSPATRQLRPRGAPPLVTIVPNTQPPQPEALSATGHLALLRLPCSGYPAPRLSLAPVSLAAPGCVYIPIQVLLSRTRHDDHQGFSFEGRSSCPPAPRKVSLACGTRHLLVLLRRCDAFLKPCDAMRS
jgi:hypothetical protein